MLHKAVARQRSGILILFCCCHTTTSFEMSPIEAFLEKPSVQRALQSPTKVRSVLDFFFGVDTGSVAGREALRQGNDIHNAMNALWYSGGVAYDDVCRAFTTTVRAAGQRQLPGNEWHESVDGKMAQLLLVDQLSRNIFRGSTEAFAYEEVSVNLARQLADINAGKVKAIGGEVYPPFVSFIAVGLMHSETLEDQLTCQQLLADAKQKHPGMQKLWDMQLTFADDHRKVVEMFGRYPHRNAAKGRVNTPTEEAWLGNKENLPAWAASQSPKQHTGSL
jgi:uncharacterized protein (DUF924 family)